MRVLKRLRRTSFAVVSIMILLLVMLGGKSSHVMAYPNNKTQFEDYVEHLYGSIYNTGGYEVNWWVYQQYEQIVFGHPHGRYKPDSQCGNYGEYEYLGYSYGGSKATNTCFPNDASSGKL